MEKNGCITHKKLLLLISGKPVFGCFGLVKLLIYKVFVVKNSFVLFDVKLHLEFLCLWSSKPLKIFCALNYWFDSVSIFLNLDNLKSSKIRCSLIYKSVARFSPSIFGLFSFLSYLLLNLSKGVEIVYSSHIYSVSLKFINFRHLIKSKQNPLISESRGIVFQIPPFYFSSHIQMAFLVLLLHHLQSFMHTFINASTLPFYLSWRLRRNYFLEYSISLWSFHFSCLD